MLQAEVTGGIHMPRTPPSTAALISEKSMGFNGIPTIQADKHFTGRGSPLGHMRGRMRVG